MLLTAALERTLASIPAAAASRAPAPLRPLAWLAALLTGPGARMWAGAIGGWLRSRRPLPPRALQFVKPLWWEVGRYAGWIER